MHAHCGVLRLCAGVLADVHVHRPPAQGMQRRHPRRTDQWVLHACTPMHSCRGRPGSPGLAEPEAVRGVSRDGGSCWEAAALAHGEQQSLDEGPHHIGGIPPPAAAPPPTAMLVWMST